MTASAPLLQTPLHALHVELGAKMVPFGGYDMPVQYREGILAEHRHTRTAAGGPAAQRALDRYRSGEPAPGGL
jgi:hypothetical protein